MEQLFYEKKPKTYINQLTRVTGIKEVSANKITKLSEDYPQITHEWINNQATYYIEIIITDILTNQIIYGIHQIITEAEASLQAIYIESNKSSEKNKAVVIPTTNTFTQLEEL